MKSILIVGGQGTLLDELVHKLSREGNRVSVLTDKTGLMRNAHEYCYPYDSDSVREVLDSSHPDTVLFLGAHDTQFRWKPRTEHKDYKNYIAGLTNLLRWSEASGVSRFVYLSSECVFEDNYLSPLNEDAPVTPRGTKGLAVALGESLAREYGAHQQLDVILVRLAHLYMIPKRAVECTDAYTRLCREAATAGTMTINAKILRSALFINDAVQALLLLLAAPAHDHSVYHVTSAERITEDAVAELIRSACARPVTIADHTVGLEHCILLQDNRFDDEFSFSARCKLEDSIPRIIQQMQSNIRAYTSPDEQRENGEGRSRLMKFVARMVPFIEALVVFIGVLAAELLLKDSDFFVHVDFFMLYVLLFSLVHGLHQSIFTASLSVIGYFISRSNGGNQLQMLMDVGTYVWIAQIFIVGMSVGHLRNRLVQLQSDKDEEIGYLATRLGDVTAINRSNVAIKNYFEQQTINSTESLGFFYDVVKQLDEANVNEMMFVAVQLLADVMGTRDAAIYSMSNSGYARLLTSTSGRAYEMGKSLKVTDLQEVFDALKTDYIFINRGMKERLPNMASVLMNDKGEIEHVIFLWDLPYERMTLQYSNTLRILTLLIRSAVERTTNYLAALTRERYWGDTGILVAAAFRDVCKVYDNAKQKDLTDYALLRIKGGLTSVADVNQLDQLLRRPMKRSDYISQMDHQLYRQLRQLDYIGYMEDGQFYILLTNTNQDESRVVIRRLADSGISAVSVNRLPAVR